MFITIVIILLVIFALLAIGLGVSAGQYPPVPGRLPFITMMAGIAIWTVAYTFVVLLDDPAAIIIAADLQYIGITLAPASFALFCYEYTRQRYTPAWVWGLLAVMPILTNIAVRVNPNDLFHISRTPEVVNGYTFLRATLGPLFWAHTAYSYALIVTGVVLLLRSFVRSKRLYRQQMALLLVGSAAPWAANAVTLTLRPPVDITSLFFGLAGFAMGWSIFRYRLLDIMPVARDRIFDSMDDAVFVLDTRNQIVDLNPAAERLFGAVPDDVIGKPMADAFPDQREAMRPFSDVTETRAEVSLRGQTFDLQISPVTIRKSIAAGRLVVLRDITERKKAEAERERLIAELNAYAHTVAHDLKNPLNVVTLYAEMLAQSEELPQKLHRAAQSIKRNGDRLATIIDDLLLLASVRGEAEIERSIIDMNIIIKDAVDRLETLISEHQATLTLPDDLPLVVGHPGLVTEVWANYLSNAIKYGGTPPHIEVGVDAPHKGLIRFWVQDNGQGLSPEEQTKLFVEFAQVGEDRTDGHGLGLSIVQRIVTRLEGEVSVESEVGKGSRFAFTLPTVNHPSVVQPPIDRAG